MFLYALLLVLSVLMLACHACLILAVVAMLACGDGPDLEDDPGYDDLCHDGLTPMSSEVDR
jgi:hypothetical protein